MRLFKNDAIAQMQLLHQQGVKVDAIVTDPPYGISRKNNFHTMSNRQGVDFGEWDKDFNPTSWLKPAYDLLKDNGSMIIFCGFRQLSTITDALESLGCEVKDQCVWVKSNPMPRNRERRYVGGIENFIWAVKSPKSKWVFNKSADKPYERSIYESPVLAGAERTAHPTQKPLSIMKRIIEIHTNEGDVVLDPFMGSGSTGVAANELGRAFIGIELEDEWYNVATSRLFDL